MDALFDWKANIDVVQHVTWEQFKLHYWKKWSVTAQSWAAKIAKIAHQVKEPGQEKEKVCLVKSLNNFFFFFRFYRSHPSSFLSACQLRASSPPDGWARCGSSWGTGGVGGRSPTASCQWPCRGWGADTSSSASASSEQSRTELWQSGQSSARRANRIGADFWAHGLVVFLWKGSLDYKWLFFNWFTIYFSEVHVSTDSPRLSVFTCSYTFLTVNIQADQVA